MRRRILQIAGVLGLLAVSVAAAILFACPYCRAFASRAVATPLATFYIEHRWLRYAEGAFLVYYPAGGAIADNPRAWLKPRLDAFQANCRYLGVDCNFGITFYVFDSREQGARYGLSLGFAAPFLRRVYTSCNQTPGHELTHVIVGQAYQDRHIRSALVREGLATLLNGEDWLDFDRASFESVRDTYLEASDLLGMNFWWRDVDYYIAASFVRYLVDVYGLEKLKNLLGQGPMDEKTAFAAVYGKPFEGLFTEWKDRLKKKGVEAGFADQ